MQASQIQLGADYAATYNGREVELRVIEVRTSRDSYGTTNYVVGRLPGVSQLITVQVKHVIGPLEQHKALKAEKEARIAGQKAAEAAHKARVHHAVKLLAELIEAQPVIGRYEHSEGYVEWDRRKPAVMVGNRGLELNDEAIEPLIVFLEEIIRRTS